MSGDLERIRSALSQTFLSEQYATWVQMLGPYSDLCDELGLEQEAWLARNVVSCHRPRDPCHDTKTNKTFQEIVLMLKEPCTNSDAIWKNSSLKGSWLAMKEGSMYISSSFSGHLRVGMVKIANDPWVFRDFAILRIGLDKAFNLPAMVKQ